MDLNIRHLANTAVLGGGKVVRSNDAEGKGMVSQPVESLGERVD